MGFIEESRQLLQDFVTPEIRTLTARLDAIENKLAISEANLHAKIDRNHSDVMAALNRLEAFHLLNERIAKLESKLDNVA